MSTILSARAHALDEPHWTLQDIGVRPGRQGTGPGAAAMAPVPSFCARKAKAPEQSVSNWKRQFLEAGRAGVAAGGKAGTSSRERQLLDELEAERSGAARSPELGPVLVDDADNASPVTNPTSRTPSWWMCTDPHAATGRLSHHQAVVHTRPKIRALYSAGNRRRAAFAGTSVSRIFLSSILSADSIEPFRQYGVEVVDGQVAATIVTADS